MPLLLLVRDESPVVVVWRGRTDGRVARLPYQFTHAEPSRRLLIACLAPGESPPAPEHGVVYLPWCDAEKTRAFVQDERSNRMVKMRSQWYCPITRHMPHLPAILLMVLPLACAPEPETSALHTEPSLRTIAVQPATTGFLRLSEVADSVGYLPLEKTAGILIGTVDKLLIDNEHVYLLDRDGARSLFVFDRHGRFVNSISASGRGPQEFDTPMDFALDSDGERLFILDTGLQKMLTYDRSGAFIDERHLPFRALNLASLGNSTYAFYCGFLPNAAFFAERLAHRLIVTDFVTAPQTHFSFDPVAQTLRYSPAFVFSHGGAEQLLLTPSFSDTVYTISAAGIAPRIAVDFGEQRLPADFLQQARSREQLLGALPRYCHAMQHVLESASHLYFEFAFGSRVQSVFHCKASGRQVVHTALANDLDGLPIGRPRALVDGNLAVGIIDAQELRQAAVRTVPSRAIATNELLASLSDEANPVLIFYRLRRF